MFEKGVCMFIFAVGVLACLGGVAAQEPCSNGEGLSPHPNCSLYYLCGPVPILQECPYTPLLYFNPLIEACDFPANVPECVAGTRPPTGTTTPIPTTTAQTTTSPTTNATTQTTTTPTTTAAPTTTASTPTPTTTRTTNATDTPETEGTPSTSTALPPVQCDPTGIHKIAHPTECNAYFWCINGELLPEKNTCPTGLLFDPEIRDCNLEDLVNCGGTTNGTTTTGPTTRPTTPPPTEWPECLPGQNTAHPYPGNCTLYIICVDGSMTFYKCPEGMLFDYIVKQCRPESVAVCASSSSPHHLIQTKDFNIETAAEPLNKDLRANSANKDLNITPVEEDEPQWHHFTSLRIFWRRVWTRLY